MTEILDCPFCGSKAGVKGDHGLEYLGCTDHTCWLYETPLSCHTENRRRASVALWNRRATQAWKLAMRVLQSNLYPELDDAERAECDALIASNPHVVPLDMLRIVVLELNKNAGRISEETLTQAELCLARGKGDGDGVKGFEKAMQDAYVGGLRRAAEIASEHNCPNAWNKIEAEAARIDTENRPG